MNTHLSEVCKNLEELQHVLRRVDLRKFGEKQWFVIELIQNDIKCQKN